MMPRERLLVEHLGQRALGATEYRHSYRRARELALVGEQRRQRHERHVGERSLARLVDRAARVQQRRRSPTDRRHELRALDPCSSEHIVGFLFDRSQQRGRRATERDSL